MDAKQELVGALVEAGLSPEQAQKLVQPYQISCQDGSGWGDLKKQISVFLAAKRIDGLSARTIENYRYTLGVFAGQVDRAVTKITVDDLREYISYLSEIRGLRDGSLLTHINTLRSFFSWLTVEGVIQRNPMLKIKSPRLDLTRSRHALSQEQLERLRDACKTYKERALVEFLVSSGCIRSWIFKYASIDASSCVSSESSLTAIQRAGSFLRFSGSRAGTNSPSARSTASGYRVRSGFVSGGLRHIRSTAPVSCSNPLLLRALVPITGTPSRRESRGRSIRICFFPASSSRLTQSTTRGVTSSVWSARFRFRSRQVASQTTMTASGSSKQMKSRATSSSAEWASKEYAPGRSTSR